MYPHFIFIHTTRKRLITQGTPYITQSVGPDVTLSTMYQMINRRTSRLDGAIDSLNENQWLSSETMRSILSSNQRRPCIDSCRNFSSCSIDHPVSSFKLQWPQLTHQRQLSPSHNVPLRYPHNDRCVSELLFMTMTLGIASTIYETATAMIWDWYKRSLVLGTLSKVN